jgi:hypothetical protein
MARKKFVEHIQTDGEKILINAQMHLFNQVSGSNNPKKKITIEGGYYGRIYPRAQGTIKTCIQLIRVESNLEAIKAGHMQPYTWSCIHEGERHTREFCDTLRAKTARSQQKVS